MFLFNRTTTLQGDLRGAMGWANEITGYVNANSDFDVTLWQAQFGYPVGTMVWSTWVESHAALEAGFAGLLAGDGYWDLIARGQEYVSAPAQDMLRQAVHGGPGDEPPPLGAATTVTTAVAAGGKLVEVMAWGAKMAAHVEQVTGLPTMFLADTYGTFGQVTWLSGAPDMATADQAGEALNGDAAYLERLGDIGELFVPASGHRGLAVRIA